MTGCSSPTGNSTSISRPARPACFASASPPPAAAGELSNATRTSYQLPIDDNDPVRVSIVQQNPQYLVYEEDQACFVVSSDAVFDGLHPAEQVSLTLAVSQQGDYLAAPGNRTVTLSADSQAHTLCLKLEDDEKVEDAGSVTVALVATDGVVPAASGSVTVTVYDNELPAYTMTTAAASVGRRRRRRVFRQPHGQPGAGGFPYRPRALPAAGGLAGTTARCSTTTPTPSSSSTPGSRA